MVANGTNPSTEGGQGKLPLDIAAQPDATGRVDATKVAPPATPEAQVSGEVAKEPATPVAKTFDEAELTKRLASVKAGYEGTLKKMRDDIARSKQEAVEAQERAEEESGKQLMLKFEGGGEDTAQLAKQAVEHWRSAKKLERQLKDREAELRELQSNLNEAGRTKGAQDFLREYQLTEEALPELLEAADLKEMELKAAKLALTKTRSQARPPEKTPKPPAAPKGQDLSKLSITQRIGLALENKL